MSEINSQIEEHENKIINLTLKIEESTDTEEKLCFTNLINHEKDFIILLFKIKSSLCKETKKEIIKEDVKKKRKNRKQKK